MGAAPARKFTTAEFTDDELKRIRRLKKKKGRRMKGKFHDYVGLKIKKTEREVIRNASRAFQLSETDILRISLRLGVRDLLKNGFKSPQADEAE